MPVRETGRVHLAVCATIARVGGGVIESCERRQHTHRRTVVAAAIDGRADAQSPCHGLYWVWPLFGQDPNFVTLKMRFTACTLSVPPGDGRLEICRPLRINSSLKLTPAKIEDQYGGEHISSASLQLLYRTLPSLLNYCAYEYDSLCPADPLTVSLYHAEALSSL